MEIIQNEQGLKQIQNTSIKLPFSSTQLDKPSTLKIFAERLIHEPVVTENFGCLVINLPEMSETLRFYNNYKKELDLFFKDKFIIADPCSEITYYSWKINREDYLKENIHPELNKILREANSKNYSSSWLDSFEDKSVMLKFVEKTIEKQNILSSAFPITPVLESSSPNALIKLAFEINDESCSISKNLEKAYLGCYLSLHSSLLSNDPISKKKFSYIATELIELLKKHNNVYLYIKFIDIENPSSSHNIEKTINVINFLESLLAIRGTEYINKHNFLLQLGGINKKFIVLIAKGADSISELMNGKSLIQKPEAYNNKNKKEFFQFGDFYDMINQIMISYPTLIDYYKKNKALPSYTEVSKNVDAADLDNHIRYSKIKRLNQIEARCIEIEQLRKDLIEGQMRGVHDRLSRSIDEELKQLAKLF